MLIFYLSILLTIVSNVLYHIFQKVTPPGANPAAALVVTYGVALLACLLALVLFPPPEGVGAALRSTNWASAGLGLSIIGLELGYLLAYRAGWNISTAGILSATGVALLLIPVGLLAFKEKLSPYNILGIVLCLAGLVLINWRR
jgi:uncharacterized membrane protein